MNFLRVTTLDAIIGENNIDIGSIIYVEDTNSLYVKFGPNEFSQLVMAEEEINYCEIDFNSEIC